MLGSVRKAERNVPSDIVLLGMIALNVDLPGLGCVKGVCLSVNDM